MKNINLNIAKFLLVIAFLALSTVSFGFVSDARRVEISNQVNSVKASDWGIDLISHAITSHLNTDEEKVIAIYLWMSRNIKYDYDLAVCADCDRQNVDTYASVYKNRKGVCSGLGNLFKYLVNKRGITAYSIGGIATTSDGRTANHVWNIVKINNTWNYVDITWALGDNGNKTPWLIDNKADFVRHKDEYIYVSYSRVEDKNLYEGMDYLKSYVTLYNSDNEKYIKSNMTSEEIAKARAVKGLAPSEAGILEAEFLVDIRNEYDKFTNTKTVSTSTYTSKAVTTTITKKEVTKTNVNNIPLIFTMSDSEFEKVRNYHYQYRENLAVYVSKKLYDKSLYNTIRHSKQKDYYKNMVKYRKMYLKGKL